MYDVFDGCFVDTRYEDISYDLSQNACDAIVKWRGLFPRKHRDKAICDLFAPQFASDADIDFSVNEVVHNAAHHS